MTAAKKAAEKAGKAEEKKVASKKAAETEVKETEVKKEAPKAKAAPKKVASKKSAAKKAAKPKGAKKGAPVAHGVGRRKASVARVWLRPGKGGVTVNQRPCDEYFVTEVTRLAAQMPMKVIPAASSYDVEVNVCGGGSTGQADAVKLAIARALAHVDESLKPLLREFGFLTVDSRIVERKKYGQKKARRKFQFVKR